MHVHQKFEWSLKVFGAKENFPDNPDQNILGLYDVLVQNLKKATKKRLVM